MNEYQRKLEEFRAHYLKKYERQLDDETLYFFIRVNEMQVDLRKQIANLSRQIKTHNITFKTGYDYFLYGLGRVTGFMFLFAVLLAFLVLVSKLI